MKPIEFLRKISVLFYSIGLLFIEMNCTDTNPSSNLSSSNQDDKYCNYSLEITEYEPHDSLNECDYLILTDNSLLVPALKLAEYRRINEYDDIIHPKVLTTFTIEPDYIYLGRPEQIKVIQNVIRDSQEKWKYKPEYIVLFADAQIKPRLFTGIPIPDLLMMADIYYADLDSNRTPDVVMGRIAASTEEEGEAYVDKLIAFENNLPGKLLFITDDKFHGIGSDHIDFEGITTSISSKLDSLQNFSMPISHYRVSDYGCSDTLKLNVVEAQAANSALVDSLNTGNKIVTFLGHANHQVLTDEHVLTAYDINKLNTIDLWISMGCNSNQYIFEDAFAKQMIRHPNSGAVAFIAPYGEGYSVLGVGMITWLYDYLFGDDEMHSVGKAYTRAMNEMHWNPSNGYFVYLGDPALVLK